MRSPGGRFGGRVRGDAGRCHRSGISQPGYPSDLRISARQRRRRVRALFCREVAAARRAHGGGRKKVGAASNIATEFVARSKPDGHTLYPFAGTTVAASMHLFKNPPVDVGKAIRVAATTSNLAFMLVVDAKSPHKNVAELTAAMKQKGSGASYAVAANPGRIMGAIYKNAAGLDALEVQYRSAPDSLNEMMSGKLDYGLHDPIFALAQHREGRLRVLAVSTANRLQSLPELPTMTESGVPMDLSLWWGVMVPTGTPKPIIDRINQWFSQIVSTEETKKFLNASGADPMINTPERSQEMFEAAIKQWGDYVRMAKIEPQ
jgi:tripartite-type tricarboxylate transporter receptor subunit TctC